jgi:hypothetical protein
MLDQMRDARGIGRLNALAEVNALTEGVSRYRETNARHDRRLRMTCSLCGRIVGAFMVQGKMRRHIVGLPDHEAAEFRVLQERRGAIVLELVARYRRVG